MLVMAASEQTEEIEVPEEEERARKVRKGFKYCRGHGIAHPLGEFSATSGNNCIVVKKVMDCVFKQAKAQGELEWYNNMRLSDRKMRQTVDYFTTQVTSGKGCKTFKVVCFREFHKAEQAIDFVETGKMMWEREAIEYWMSTPGGNLDCDSAQLRWDDMVAHWKERRIPCDNRGPNPKKPMQLRVCTGTNIDYRNTTSHGLQVVATRQECKKPEDTEAAVLFDKVLVDQDRVGTGSDRTTQESLACRMVARQPGEAFNSCNMMIEDVTKLCEGDIKLPDAPSPAKPETSSPAAQEEPEFWPKDSAIASAKRTLKRLFQTASNQRKHTEDSLKAFLQVAQTLSTEVQEDIRGEVTVCITRHKALVLVGANDVDQLQAFLIGFEAGGGDIALPPKVLSSGVSSATAGALRAAPPCRLFRKLQTMRRLEAIIDTLDECTCQKDVDYVIEVRFPAVASAINDLISYGKQSGVELKKAMNTHKAPTKGKAKAKAAPAIAAALGPQNAVLDGSVTQLQKQIAFLEAAGNQLSPIPTYREGESWAPDALNKPLVVAADPTNHAAFVDLDESKSFINDMRAQVQQQEASLRVGDCRASSPVPPQLEAALRTRCAQCFSSPHASLPMESSMAGLPADQTEVLIFVMRMSGSCLLSDACKPFCEKEYLAALRVSVSGCRQVIMCRSNTLLHVCKTETEDDASSGLQTTFTKDMMRAKRLMATLEPSDIGKLAADGAWFGTVGPMDLLYVPPGFVMLESSAQETCWGYRVSVFVNTAAGLEDLQKELAKVLPTEQKRRQLLSNYITISQALVPVPLAAGAGHGAASTLAGGALQAPPAGTHVAGEPVQDAPPLPPAADAAEAAGASAHGGGHGAADGAGHGAAANTHGAGDAPAALQATTPVIQSSADEVD